VEGRLQETLRRHCTVEAPRDLVALVIDLRWANTAERWTLVDRAQDGRTAMSRTTAFTTSVVSQLAAQHGLGEHGVRPLELIGHDAKAAAFVLDELGKRHVRVERRELV
jgi:saccharopine dehydrogenase-like NADP-dependent oxidoreductase